MYPSNYIDDDEDVSHALKKQCKVTYFIIRVSIIMIRGLSFVMLIYKQRN